jgi:1-pyrroline-5-carboxylate dehydrogenase
MFVHSNWKKTDLYEQMKMQAKKRSLNDLTIGPVLSWDNERIRQHIEDVKSLEGAEILFGGYPLKNHNIPS